MHEYTSVFLISWTDVHVLNIFFCLQNSGKRKNPATQIFNYLKQSEEEDKRSMQEINKMDVEILSEMKKILRIFRI